MKALLVLIGAGLVMTALSVMSPPTLPQWNGITPTGSVLRLNEGSRVGETPKTPCCQDQVPRRTDKATATARRDGGNVSDTRGELSRDIAVQQSNQTKQAQGKASAHSQATNTLSSLQQRDLQPEPAIADVLGGQSSQPQLDGSGSTARQQPEHHDRYTRKQVLAASRAADEYLRQIEGPWDN